MEHAPATPQDPLVAEALESLRQLRAEVTEATQELEATRGLLDERTRKLLHVETALSAVLDEVGDVVLAVDSETVVQAWSREAERWLAVPAERSIGRRLGDVVKDEAALALVRAVRAATEGQPDADSAVEVEVEGGAFRVRPLGAVGGAVVVGRL